MHVEFEGRVTPAGDCVVWTGRLNRTGYPVLSTWVRRYGTDLAHRVSHLLQTGPMSLDMTIDHTCFNPACVKPEHLRVLSRVSNSRNQRSALREECANGHPFTEANTYYRTVNCTGRRQCRRCNLEARRRYVERKAAA